MTGELNGLEGICPAGGVESVLDAMSALAPGAQCTALNEGVVLQRSRAGDRFYAGVAMPLPRDPQAFLGGAAMSLDDLVMMSGRLRGTYGGKEPACIVRSRLSQVGIRYRPALEAASVISDRLRFPRVSLGAVGLRPGVSLLDLMTGLRNRRSERLFAGSCVALSVAARSLNSGDIMPVNNYQEEMQGKRLNDIVGMRQTRTHVENLARRINCGTDLAPESILVSGPSAADSRMFAGALCMELEDGQLGEEKRQVVVSVVDSTVRTGDPLFGLEGYESLEEDHSLASRVAAMANKRGILLIYNASAATLRHAFELERRTGLIIVGVPEFRMPKGAIDELSARFDAHVRVPLPSDNDRIEIWEQLLAEGGLRTCADMGALVQSSKGWSYTDIEDGFRGCTAHPNIEVRKHKFSAFAQTMKPRSDT